MSCCPERNRLSQSHQLGIWTADRLTQDCEWFTAPPGWYLVYDGGVEVYRIHFCPFCGAREDA